MTRDAATGIRLLDGHLPYRDGSEDQVLAILRRVRDRSSGSNELAQAITDWPTRYHLSRLRSNLLRPLRLTSEMRILEIGAGTGAITRYLGETGADVVALEGNLERARAAAVRCADLDNVEVVCGPLASFEDDDGFDLVCLIGVLEYAASGVGGAGDHQSFLNRAAWLIRGGGALLLAIENQIGVKYLLGYHEDHLGLPWVGVDGYRGDHGIRTFTRTALRAMLAAAGLSSQHWYFPFPDYKLPTVVLSEPLYELSESPDLVDQLVRRPVGDSEDRALLVDDRRAHRILVEAGIGPEVANSFLVLAAPGSADLSFAPDPEVLAWRLGDDRRSAFRRHLEVVVNADALWVRTPRSPEREPTRAADWLVHHPHKDERFLMGPTIEEMVIEACDRGDIAGVKDALCSWRWFLDQHVETRDRQSPSHPFIGPSDAHGLPPEYLDVALSNFVLADDGLHFIDREWRALGGVSAPLVTIRALWLMAAQLIRSGTRHLWPPETTVDELAGKLADLCELDADPPLMDRVRDAEVELQHLVTGRGRDQLVTDLAWLGAQSRISTGVARPIPVIGLEDRIAELEAQLRDLAQRHRALGESASAMEHELRHELGEALKATERLRGDNAVLAEHLEGTRRELDAYRHELDAAREELDMWRERQRRFEDRLPVRLLRAVQRVLGR